LSERHYWDTCSWLELFNEPEEPIGPMRTMWGAMERGGLEILFSALTLAECLFKREGAKPPHADPHPADEMFYASGVILVQVDREVGERARSLRRKHKLSTPDAVHLACAIQNNTDHFVTRDAEVTKLPTLYRRDLRLGSRS
jgi:predicted nucleic acid-binding protein